MERLSSHFEIAELVSRFLEGRLSADESRRLEQWIEESEQHRKLWRRLTDADYLEGQLQYWHMQEERSSGPDPWKTRISEKLYIRRTVARKIVAYAAAISVLVMVGAAGWHFFDRHSGQQVSGETMADLDQVRIMPRGKVAQLVLGSGRVVNLSSDQDETLSEKDGTRIHNGGKMLRYIAAKGQGEKQMYHTLIIPRGAEYQITLADGTKVWLNAESSLRYPTQFGGNERKVFLSGEGYFEVAKDEQHPFIVEAEGTRIKALGTKFNVSAYAEDATKRVVLAEGAVLVGKVGNKKGGALLKPGYGAVLTNNEASIQVHQVNVEATLAWKNGMFVFDGESLGSIMKKLSRWYNVDIRYEDNVVTRFHFTGRIQRYENITGILHLLELTGKVRFEVKGNEVIVRPESNV